MSRSPKTVSNNTLKEHNERYTQDKKAKVVKELDDRIQQLRERFISKQPYLITLPSDVPYRKHHHDPNTWWLGTPFSKDEEQLQYMSFLAHDGEDEELLKAEGGWADESGHMLAWESSPQTDYTSRPNTPATQPDTSGARKKISLKDYKTKDKSRVNTPERRPGQDDLRREHFKSKVDLERKPAKSEEDNDPDSKRSETVSSREFGPKVKIGIHKDRPKSPPFSRQDSLPPTKRRKLSSENLHVENKNGHELTRTKPEKHEDNKPLPTLLSPTIPSNEKRKQQRALPNLLSPDLPPGLDKALSANHRSEEVRSILKAGIGSPYVSNEKKSAGKTATTDRPSIGERPRSVSQLSATGAKAPIDKVSSPTLKPLSQANKKDAVPAVSPRPKQEPFIRLKYGKKNRRRVEMLLKFNPRPKKPSIQDDHKPSGIKSTSSVTSKIEKKRSSDALPEQPAKKQKLADSSLEVPVKIERPVTPLGRNDGKSPAMSASKMKSNFSTPKRDLKSVAMQRVASSETNEARTPRGDHLKTSTPLSSGHMALQKTSPGPSSNPIKSEDRAAWGELNDKFFTIGRGLKREGSKLATEHNTKEHALSVVLLIEALLCFMLNSGAQAQARPNVDPGWSNIIPYHIMVFKQSRRYRHLHGLVIQLGAVVRQHIQNEDIRRLAREPLPDDHGVGSAPTPGSDGTTRTSDDPERYKKRYLEFRDRLVENSRELQTAWLDGSRLLPLDLLEIEYPRTWTARSKDASKRFPDKLDPKALKKDFYLPMDVTTNVFEATNFALTFLKEWSNLEKLSWSPKVEL